MGLNDPDRLSFELGAVADAMTSTHDSVLPLRIVRQSVST
jgi:hypothetical protein